MHPRYHLLTQGMIINLLSKYEVDNTKRSKSEGGHKYQKPTNTGCGRSTPWFRGLWADPSSLSAWSLVNANVDFWASFMFTCGISVISAKKKPSPDLQLPFRAAHGMTTGIPAPEFPSRSTKVPTSKKSPVVEPKSSPHHRQALSSSDPLNSDPYSLSQPKSTPSSVRERRHSHLHNTKRRYSRFSRRAKIIIAAVITCLIILIIGLAAGLSLRNRAQNLPLPTENGGPYQGDLTYYAPGLGACGVASKDGENIVSVSYLLFDAASTSSNPNQNPLCGKFVRARRTTGSVDLKVVDRCTGCKPRDLDITKKTFAKLANVDLGRVDVEWSWLEGVPGAVT